MGCLAKHDANRATSVEVRGTTLGRILITGGAGFIGSSLALLWKRSRPDDELIAFDNLRRAGSELAVDRLKLGGVQFVHGDVRNPEDFDQIKSVDLVIDCAAEPSVQAGYGSESAFLVHNNLFGTVNCLEFCRRHDAGLIFLSTSRVYPIAGLRALPLRVDLHDRVVQRRRVQQQIPETCRPLRIQNFLWHSAAQFLLKHLF